VQPSSRPAPNTLDKDATKLAEGTGATAEVPLAGETGRVIAGYGPTPNGQQKRWHQTSPLPENTPVKAAEDGVVAYAGNELKGLRQPRPGGAHPNGYVTAYAHAKELLVKRRGPSQNADRLIARSGQTGKRQCAATSL